MLNLLRPEQKKKIIREYHVRFFVMAFSLLLCIQVIAAILLIPSYTASKARSDTLNSQSSVLQAQSVSHEVADLNALVKQTNDYISVFPLISTSTSMYSTINNLVGARSQKIKINAVMSGVQNNQPQIILQGVAATRQDLLDFITQLKKQSNVSSVNLPISDFSQPQNINFSLTVTMGASKT